MGGVALATVLFTFGPSRLSTISGEEASAHGRIDAWYEAYQMFKNNPLFGVGQGRFTDYNNLTAHNSYVLVMAELGVVGLFFFTGLIYHPIYWLWRHVFTPQDLPFDSADLGLISALYASLFGVLAAIFFLSRSYMLIPYMLIALVAAASRIISREHGVSEISMSLPPRHFRNIAVLTLAQIIIINIVVKVFI